MSSSVVPSPVLWLEGEIKDCFPILHIELVPQGWFSQMWILSKHYLKKSGVTPCWLVQGCIRSASLFQIWGGFIQIPSLRACPNVETSTDGFPYSGNCSMLCGVDVCLRSGPFAGLSLPGDFRSWESPQTLRALFIGLFEHVERFRN